MISSQLSQEQQRILISKIVQYEGKLNSVFDKEPLIFSEITKVFNIPDSRDTTDSLYKLKERLVNICLQEKEEFLEYLCLPKFRQVSQHALELLKTALQEISQRIKIEQENAKFDALVNGIERYIPKVSSLAEIQNYHLRIFQLYSKSDICPVGAMERQLEMMNAQKNQLNELKSQQWNFKNSPYSNFVKSVPQDMDPNKYDYWTNQVNDHNIAIQDSERIYPSGFYRGIQKPMSSQLLMHPVLSPSSSLGPNQSSTSLKYRGNRQSKISSSHMIEQYSQASSIKREKQEENSRMVEDNSQPLSNISELKHKTFNVVDPNFKNCVCKGKIQKVGQQEFICDSCNGKYHSECLRMSRTSESQPRKKCPICTSQQIQSEWFQLIRPSILSSWAIYNRQNTTQSAIKFTQSVLNQMKKIIAKPQNKIYLKLITIKEKSMVHYDESLNHMVGKMDDLKTKLNKEIGEGKQGMNEQEGEIDQQMDDRDDSEMLDEANEANEANDNSNKQPTNQQSAKQSTQITQSKSSIEFTSQYISQMLKSSSPVISLNFGYSPQYQDTNSKELVEEQWLIYYGIYEVKRKQLPEILYKLTCESNVMTEKGERGFDERAISNILGNQAALQNGQAIVGQNRGDSQAQRNVRSIPLKFLISKKQLRQVSKSTQHQSKQIYPIRFTSCHNILHVFQLQNYLESAYHYNLNSKTKQHYKLKRLSPDIDLNQCPLCVGGSVSLPQGVNGLTQQKKHIYLDRKLHALLNDSQTLEEIIVRYDDASSGQEYNYVDVLVDMKYSINPQTREIDYCYFLSQLSSAKQEIQEEKTVKQQGKQQGKANKDEDHREGSESMQVENYMKDQVDNRAKIQPNKQQDEDSVIDYGVDQLQQQNQADKAQQQNNPVNNPHEN